jgi:5-methylthioadenosine/S-adenosylhomocysteine deaminase
MTSPTVVRGGHVLTMGPTGDLAGGAVAFAGDEVLAAGPFTEVAARFPDAEVVGDEHGVVLPGLVNGHTHLSEALICGMGEDLTPFEWGERLVAPAGRHLTREMGRVGAMLKGAELLLSEVTCVNDMFCRTNLGSLASLGAVDGLEVMGLRGVVAFGAEDAADPQPVADIMAEHEALADRCAPAAWSASGSGSGPCSARATSSWPPRPGRPASTAGRSTPTWPRSRRSSSVPGCAGAAPLWSGPPTSACWTCRS